MNNRRWSAVLLCTMMISTVIVAGRLFVAGNQTEEVPLLLEERTLPGQSESQSESFLCYNTATDEQFSLTKEELLPAAIACEMDLNAPEEAIKAQAVACYTLFCRKRDNNEAIACNPELWQVWTTTEQLKEKWGDDFSNLYAALQGILEEVDGEIITYEDEPILAAYTAITCGNTEEGSVIFTRSYPYLQPVASPGDCFADGYFSKITLSATRIAQLAKAAGIELIGSSAMWLSDSCYTDRGTLLTAKLGGTLLSGQKLREILQLPSANFTVEHSGDEFCFTVLGRGHGVGLSQAGAIFFAKRGMGYEEILSHYYPGTVLQKSPTDKLPGTLLE